MTKFRDFESARKFVRKLKLTGNREWRKYCKSGNKPVNIPNSPDYSYKNKGWIGYGDWLGTERFGTVNREFYSYENARKFVHKLHIAGQKEWIAYCQSGNKPNFIPQAPYKTYKGKGWIGYADWLGNNRPIRPTKFRSYIESRDFVQKLGLKSFKEWNEYCKSGNKPDDIPARPWVTYKEWKKK
jgi:hypothetical protein